MASPLTSDQKQQIRRLIEKEVPVPEIVKKLDVPAKYVIAQKALLTWEKNRASEEHDATVEDAITTTFGLEKDLQKALRGNLSQLEKGLEVADEGKERHVPSGYIDITAKDGEGRTAVVELKAGEADRAAIGQILSYMGDLTAETKQPIRGILIAGSFSINALSASLAVPNLELKTYRCHFTFESVSPSTQ
ncbi:MAG: endonuclease NucS domain-containing protein [Bryobacteraceae bacterium]